MNMQTGEGSRGNLNHTAEDGEYDAIHKRLQKRIGTTIVTSVLVGILGVGGIIKSKNESPFPRYESAKETLTTLTNYRNNFGNPDRGVEVTYRPEEINPILEENFNSLSQYATSLDNIVASVREDIKTMEESPEIKSYLARQDQQNMAGSAAIVGALGIILAGAKISDKKREKEVIELIRKRRNQRHQ